MTGTGTDPDMPPLANGGATPDMPPLANRGAMLPFWEYEAENAKTNASLIGPSRTFGDIASEASGRRAVKLASKGQNVEFKLDHPTNSIVVRYAIPDDAGGNGMNATLGLYINGVRKTSLQLTSRYSWTYGDADAQGSGSNSPGAGTPHHFYDEAHVMFEEVPAGSTVSLQRDDGDTAPYYIIDLVDFEKVAPPLSRPDGSLSITDFGATPDDGTDDGPAIQKAIDAGKAQNKVVWIPKGTFESTTVPLTVADVTIRGAGMWYSTIHGYYAQFKVTTGFQAYDFAIFGDVTYRDDQKGDVGFDGPAGTGSRIENIWVEHEKVGWWVGKGAYVGSVTSPLTDGLVIHGVRIRNTFADGVNFANATKNSVVEQSHFRNTGDDSIATWSFAADGPLPCEGNVFRFNTVQLPWRATCLAVYGGKNNTVEDNTCADTSNYPGLLVSTTFTAIPFSGTTTLQRNTLTRAGGSHYGQEFGALRIFADQGPIAGIRIKDTLIESPTFAGIHFGGSQQSTDITFDGVQVNDYGSVGMWITSESHGSARFDNVVMNGPMEKGLKNDATSSFNIIKGGGNSGWDGQGDAMGSTSSSSSSSSTGGGTSGGTPGSFFIKSVWKGTYLFDNNKVVDYAGVPGGDIFAWVFEDKNGFERIKNVGTGRYMNIESQLPYVESSSVSDTFYSGYWKVEDVSGNKRLRNAWKGTYLNVEAQNGSAQCTDYPADLPSTQWTFVPN